MYSKLVYDHKRRELTLKHYASLHDMAVDFPMEERTYEHVAEAFLPPKAIQHIWAMSYESENMISLRYNGEVYCKKTGVGIEGNNPIYIYHCYLKEEE